MKLPLLTAAVLLLLAGCSTVQPPERPVAYVFPTVRSLDSLQHASERSVTTAQISQWLARAGIYDELRAAGMLQTELQLLQRGLERNGYAELDVRKTALDLKWLSLTTLANGSVDIIIGYARDHGRNMRASMQRLAAPPPEILQQCSLPGRRITQVWHGATPHTRRWFIEMAELNSDKPSFWLKRLLLK